MLLLTITRNLVQRHFGEEFFSFYYTLLCFLCIVVRYVRCLSKYSRTFQGGAFYINTESVLMAASFNCRGNLIVSVEES